MSSNSTVIEAPQSVIPPGVRKYDKRSEGAKKRWEMVRSGEIGRPERNTKSQLQLTRRQTNKLIREYDAIAKLVQIYAAAYEARNYALCFQMRESADFRLNGRYFTAVNPSAEPNHVQDNRLQVAIKQLVVSGKPAELEQSKVLAGK